MTTSAFPADRTAPSGAQPSGAVPASRRTVDAPTRAFHWLFALCFAGAYLTGDGERLRLVHVTLGYTMVGLLGFRIVWGLIGPKPARFSTWWTRLHTVSGVVQQLKQGRWPGTLAQNAGMILAIVAMVAGVILTTASGWLSYEELAGEWMEDVHEFFGNTLLFVVLAHLALVVGLSLLRRRNLVTPMITGRTAGRGPDVIKRNAAWLGALLLAGVLAFWVSQWQDALARVDSAASAPVTLSSLWSDLTQGDDDDDD
jgi:cytochrome b